MKFGFIGAGKVGFSLGKYLADGGYAVAGYYSEFEKDALEAAEFANTKKYETLSSLVEDSDVLFLTVSDGQIVHVWEQLKSEHVRNKIICHCSGALSSEVFSDIAGYGNYGYSIHPLFAVSNKYDSYKELSNSYFTIEGASEYLNQMKEVFEKLGNKVVVIDKKEKVKYHAAAAMCSNLVVGLINLSEDLLVQCGFDKESAHNAIAPIINGNMQHIIEDGTVNALTGPIERNDVSTVKKHLEVLKENELEVYKSVSREVLKVAKMKNSQGCYDEMEEILE